MAEIVGLAASIAGLLTTAGALFKVADSIFRLGQRIHSAQDDINKFGREITTFASAISFAHQSLDLYAKKYKQSTALQEIQTHEVLGYLDDDSYHILEAIKELKGSIPSMENSLFRFWSRIKWARQGRHVKALSPMMESVKSNLILVLCAVRLEVAIRENDVEVISQLRKEIKTYQKVIVILKRCQIPEERRITSFKDTATQDFLLDLVQDLADKGKRYNASHPATRTSIYSTAGFNARSETINTDSQISARSENSLQELTSSQSSLETHLDRTATQALSVHGNEFSGSEVNFHHEDEDGNSTKRAQQDSESSRENTTDVLTTTRRLRRQKPLFLGRTLHRLPHANMGHADGFIETQEKRTAASVHVDISLEHSIISIDYAQYLGCENFETVDATQLIVDDLTYISQSMVAFDWGRTRGALRTSPIRVRCYVFEEGVDGIVVGRDFMQQKRRHEFANNNIH